MKKLILKNIFADNETGEEKVGFPLIEIRIDDCDSRVVGYLSPFRGYRFQISQTMKGERDLGSSEVIGLANIITAFEGYDKEAHATNLSIWSSNVEPLKGCLRALILATFSEFEHRYGELFGRFNYDNYAVISEFIDATIDYIKDRISK